MSILGVVFVLEPLLQLTKTTDLIRRDAGMCLQQSFAEVLIDIQNLGSLGRGLQQVP